MEINSEENEGEKFVSHKASIKSINEANDEIEVHNQTGAEVTLRLRDVLELNQPHIFAEDILGNLVFEDGLKCDYRSVDTKLKLI